MRTKATLSILALVILAAPALAAEQDPGTPTRAYLFDEGYGRSAKPVGKGVDGKIHGFGWTTGAFGYLGDRALTGKHSGGGRVDFIEPYKLGSQATWSIWLKLNPGMGPGAGGDVIREAILSSRPGSTKMLVMRERWRNVGPVFAGKMRWFSENLSSDDGATPRLTKGYTGWHHLALVWNDTPDADGTRFFVYWDGFRISDDVWYKRDMASNPPGLEYATGVALGVDYHRRTSPWVGGFDEFVFYNRALTAHEVAWLANNSITDVWGAAVPVPELGALALFGLGALGLAQRMKRRKR